MVTAGEDRPARAIFLGSGAFALPILETLAVHPALELVAVVSAPDRPAGRGRRARPVPVADLARRQGWPLRQPVRLRDPGEQVALLALRPDILLLADYGQIVPAALLEAPAHGPLNVHPSLLPRHRGASPIAATILAGDRETGVTVIRMDADVDGGPIVARERLAVGTRETAPELESRLADLGARLLGKVIEPWLSGAVKPAPQPAEGVTVTHPLRRSDGRLQWNRSAPELERQVRAYQPWPGSFSDSPIGALTVWRAAAVPVEAARMPPVEPGAGGPDRRPGTILPYGSGLAVVCGVDALDLLDVQPAGRRRMSGRDLRNGFPGLVGARLA